MRAPTVTVCVPVFDSAHLVRETLESLRAQTYAGFAVEISVDKSNDASADVCRSFVDDPRFTVLEQGERLGWVGNVNALLRRVETEYLMILPHDDLLHPRCLERLLAHAELAREAVAVYPDIEYVGVASGREQQPSLTGDKDARLIEFLSSHFNAVGFRALVRATAAPIPLLRANAHDGFAADTVWLLELASLGELHRVPEVLYQKRRSPSSVVSTWRARGRDELLAAWVDHCAECARVVLPEAVDDRQRSVFLFACVGRLLSAFRPLWLDAALRPRSDEEVIALVSTFLTRLLGATTDADVHALLARPELPRVQRRFGAPSPTLPRAKWRRFVSALVEWARA